MDEIPQPAGQPYSVGDRVRVYLGPDDPDVEFHDEICEVTEVFSDDLDEHTGRTLDALSYALRSVELDEELPVTFRHSDLVPAD